MLEDPDEVRRRYKQASPGSRAAGSAGICPICGAVFFGTEDFCFWCDHGCKNGCGPVSLREDGFCQVCGTVTFRCPGEGCKSKVHVAEAAL